MPDIGKLLWPRSVAVIGASSDTKGLRGRILHFAPERALKPLLRSRATEYVTTDLFEPADIQADITKLPFPDDRWDVIISKYERMFAKLRAR